MFQVPREHVAEMDEVKRAVGVHHHYLDGWIYLFLSNKKFDVKETIAKLQRRDNMERTVFSKYTTWTCFSAGPCAATSTTRPPW